MAAATVAYQRLLAARARGLTAAMSDLWLGLGSYRDEDIPRWERLIAPVADAAAEESAAAAVAYVSTVTETPVPPVRTPEVLADTEAPFKRMWHHLGSGMLWEDARRAATSAVEEVSYDVVHGSARRASDSARVVGWRRVLVGESCEWCARVATQVYQTAESADFGHDRCDCTVAPIVGDVDPGRLLNRDLLERIGPGRADAEAREAAARAAEATRLRDRALAQAEAADGARRRRLEALAARHQREAAAWRARAAELAAPPALDAPFVDPTGAPVER